MKMYVHNVLIRSNRQINSASIEKMMPKNKAMYLACLYSIFFIYLLNRL